MTVTGGNCTKYTDLSSQLCAGQLQVNLKLMPFVQPQANKLLKAITGCSKPHRALITKKQLNPQFLFRIERDPEWHASPRRGSATESVARKSVYRISDLELASRLSFFLWSSIPDNELLDMATRGELSRPKVLQRQVRRMLEAVGHEVVYLKRVRVGSILLGDLKPGQWRRLSEAEIAGLMG